MTKRAFFARIGPDEDAEADGPGASRTLIEQAYHQLREDIIEGRLGPGEKLRVEHLRQHYQVGAGTLREAITRLVSDALVEAEGQRGFPALRHVRAAAEQFQGLDRWRCLLRYISDRIAPVIGPPKPPAALPATG